MFRATSRLSFRPRLRGGSTARLFHRITTEFITHDAKGSLVTERVPAIVGDPGEAYVLIPRSVGHAFRAAISNAVAVPADMEGRCKLTFFPDSSHFGFGGLSIWTYYYCKHRLRRSL